MSSTDLERPPLERGHLLTVDVEEYFQVSAFSRIVPRAEWDRLPSRVERGTTALLEELERAQAYATFFVLGWVAERHPRLVRSICEAGHEVATHGFAHRRVSEMSAEEFRADLRRSKQVLEQVTGNAVIGHRAPSFSITPGNEWALDVLIEEGFRYDSSLFPIHRYRYGYPSARPTPHLIQRESGTLLELPLATVPWGGIRLPAAGGAYLRLLPFALTRRAFGDHSPTDDPAVFYVHPWELDPEQPRLPVSPLARLRHYTGLSKTRERLRLLLEECEFTSVERRFDLEGIGLGERSARAVAYG